MIKKSNTQLRIPISPETVATLEEMALAAGYINKRGTVNLSDYLRDMLQERLGDAIDLKAGLTTWGGERRKKITD